MANDPTHFGLPTYAMVEKFENMDEMEIGIAIGVGSLVLAILIPTIQFFWKKYFTIPYLTIEVRQNGGQSIPIGISSNTPVRPDGYLDGNNAIRIFQLTWKLELVITNNSDASAFFPKLDFLENGISLSELETMNELEPIKAGESKRLNCKYSFIEEAGPGQRTELHGFPKQMENLRIRLKYENGRKVPFFTIYTHVNRSNHQSRRSPKNR